MTSEGVYQYKNLLKRKTTGHNEKERDRAKEKYKWQKQVSQREQMSRNEKEREGIGGSVNKRLHEKGTRQIKKSQKQTNTNATDERKS